MTGHNAQTQRPKEGVLGLFHVAEQAREVNDAGHIRLGELNTSFGSEFVGHSLSLYIMRWKITKCIVNKWPQFPWPLFPR